MKTLGPVSAIVLSGFTWLVVGFFLLYKGLFLVVVGVLNNGLNAHSFPLMNFLGRMTGSKESAAFTLIFAGLVLGLFKSRFALGKTVQRTVKRLVLQSSPIRIQDIYTTKYLMLIAVMAGMGMSLKYLPIPIDIKSLIDITVGSALISGAFLYFKYAASLKAEVSKKK